MEDVPVASIITLKVDGTEYKVDLDLESFSGGELNGIERNTGMRWLPWIKALTDRNVSSLAWTALAWVAVRRAGSFMPFDEFEDSIKILDLIGAVDPDEAAPAVEAATRKRKPRA
jgi:hypothetical protein